MRSVVFVLTMLATVFTVAHPSAQIVSRPTDPPIVTAENDSWYRFREPLLFAGDVYYPAGPQVFFNGNTMIRTGQYNGVPLYADTTIEPYSVVFVPIAGGLMQPYARAREGEIARPAGIRVPALPGGTRPELPMAPMAPTRVPQPVGAIAAFTPEPQAVGTTGEPQAVGTTGRDVAPAATGTGGVVAQAETPGLATVRRAASNDGVWLRFMGGRWVSAGAAVPLRADEFVRVGDYAGFPVFARRNLHEERIYLPSVRGFVAPFRLLE